MNMRKPDSVRKMGEMGNLDHLSEELVLSILSRIDLKILCQCLLVSKRFASIIYQVQTVSVTLPSITLDSLGITNNLGFVNMFQCLVCEDIPEFIESSSYEKLKFCNILSKFRELKSIHVEFTYPMTSRYSSLLKWEAKFNGAMVESLACIFPASMHDKNKKVSVIDLDQYTTYPKEYQVFSISCCREWLMAIYLIIESHDTLESVTVTDSGKHGRIVMKDQQLVNCRANLLDKGFLNTINPKVVWIGQVTDLQLPVSGYTMKSVKFVVMDFIGESNTGSQHHAQMSWKYHMEGKVLDEAIKKIFSIIREKETVHNERVLYSSSECHVLSWGTIH